MLIPLLYFILRPIIWLSWSLLTYFILLFGLILTWRSYKIIYSRRWRFSVNSSDAILITGATSGIGLALAKHLHSIGYSIIAAYYNSNEPGYAELSKLKNVGKQQIILIELDVRNEESVSKAGQEVRKKLKDHDLRLYSVVNNAGLGSLQPFPWLKRKAIRQLVETNLTGSLLVTRELLPLLIESRGRIINVSSGLGFVPGATYITYGVTKCALIYLTRALNLELGERYKLKSIAVVPHNFIKNTNICAQMVKNNELDWSELSGEERKLYGDYFKHYSDLAKNLESATAEIQKAANKQEVKSSKKRSTSGQAPNQAAVIFKSIVAALKGESQVKKIEDSGVLECFEDAIRLPDPPEIIFAGDSAFNLLVGTLLLTLPNAFTNLLGPSVAPNLYK